MPLLFFESPAFPAISYEERANSHSRTKKWIDHAAPKIAFHQLFLVKEFRAAVNEQEICIELEQKDHQKCLHLQASYCHSYCCRCCHEVHEKNQNSNEFPETALIG